MDGWIGTWEGDKRNLAGGTHSYISCLELADMAVCVKKLTHAVESA